MYTEYFLNSAAQWPTEVGTAVMVSSTYSCHCYSFKEFATKCGIEVALPLKMSFSKQGTQGVIQWLKQAQTKYRE